MSQWSIITIKGPLLCDNVKLMLIPPSAAVLQVFRAFSAFGGQAFSVPLLDAYINGALTGLGLAIQRRQTLHKAKNDFRLTHESHRFYVPNRICANKIRFELSSQIEMKDNQFFCYESWKHCISAF